MKVLPRASLFLFMLLVGLASPCWGGQGRESFVGLYGGPATERDLVEIGVSSGDYVDAYVTSLFFGRQLTDSEDLVWEVEGQLAKHWGLQNHYEFNALLVLRWLPFFWDDLIDTSFAIGNGFSYATEVPQVEVEESGETSQLLNYLLLEMEFAVPRSQHWSLITRIHHRSGVFGLIHGITGGSNFVTAGLKYRF